MGRCSHKTASSCVLRQSSVRLHEGFICIIYLFVCFLKSFLPSTTDILLIYFCVFSLSLSSFLYLYTSHGSHRAHLFLHLCEDADAAQNCWLGKRPHDTFARGIRAMTQHLSDLTADLLSVWHQILFISITSPEVKRMWS